MEPMPDMYRVECSSEDYAAENNIMGLFMDADIRVSEKYREKLYYHDQTAINLVCKGKIKIFDFSYNLQTFTFNYISHLLYHPKRKEIRQARKDPKIIHYTGIDKPWIGYCPLREYYFRYEKLIPFNIKYPLKFKLKVFFQFLRLKVRHFYYILRFILSPIIKVSRKEHYFEITVLSLFKFNLFK